MTVYADTMKATARDWIGLAALTLPCLLVSMDLTVLNLAVPHISAELNPTSTQLLWIVDIYGFLIAGFLITMGTLGDRIGRRRLLLIGSAAFGAASILAAFSTTSDLLIASRALLGIAGATLMPSTLSLIRNMFRDDGQRTTAIGIWTTSFSVGAIAGPLLGGALLEQFWWGSVFLINVPVMALFLALGPILLPEFRVPNAGRFDLTSAGLSLAAVLTFIYGIKRIAEHGPELVAGACVLIGLVLAVAFIRRQSRVKDPLIDPELFRFPGFAVSITCNLLGFFVLFGTFLLTAQYLQLVVGLSPFWAGMWSVPGSIAFIVGSMGTPILSRRVRPAYLMAGGLLVAAIGFAVLAGIGSGPGLAMLVIASMIYALGLSPVYILSTDLIVTTAPPERAGAASAVSETSTELGGAMGIAIIGSIATAVYRGQMAGNAIAGNAMAGVPEQTMEIARNTLGGAVAAASSLPGETSSLLLTSAHAAFTRALEVTSLVSAAVTLALAVLAAVALRNVRR